MNDNVEIASNEIFKLFWRNRLQIAFVCILGAFLGGGLSYLVPKRYTSTVTLSPVRDDAKGQLGGAAALLGQLGGLGGLAGLTGGSDKTAEYIATLKSSVLTERFIADNELLPIIFYKDWDSATGKWKEAAEDDIPTLWDGEEIFQKKIRKISEDKKTGLVLLSITWLEPKVAASWAENLVKMVNSYLRSKAIASAQANLDYLNKQASQTTVIEIQKAIYSLVEVEIKKIMIANAGEEYAFRIIDPPRVAEEESSPKRLAYALTGLMFGLLSVLVNLLIRFSKTV